MRSSSSAVPPPPLSPGDLEAYLHEQIPISAAMGVGVTESSPDRIVLRAPLSLNRNHLGTFFGGSLHTLPTLACYSGLWSILRASGSDGHVVVKSSSADYLHPVTGDPRAVWMRPDAAEIESFLLTLRRRGRARIALSAVVESPEGLPSVEYRGVFVAIT